MDATRNTYTVHELAALSGVSVRTLHYYDELGLLRPTRAQNNYRYYGPDEVDRLLQILLYKEIGMRLTVIKDIIDNPQFDTGRALREHLSALQDQKARVDGLIASVEKALASTEGKTSMSDQEKFESFKRKLVEENEERFGAEVRQKYGDEAVDASNAKMMGLTEEQYQHAQALEAEMKGLLSSAMEEGNPASDEAQRACDLHRQWLTLFWKEGSYTKEAHLGLGEMYVADDRFKAYYDAAKPGTAGFLRDALKIYCA